MNKVGNKLEEVIIATVQALGYEFWGSLYVQKSGQAALQVYIDSLSGITLEDCQKVSRRLSVVLDVENDILGRYLLEVSSPGMDRLLFTLLQCQRYYGHKVQIKLRIPQGQRRNYSGILKQVLDERLSLEIDDTVIEIAWADIQRVNLCPNFNIVSQHEG